MTDETKARLLIRGAPWVTLGIILALFNAFGS